MEKIPAIALALSALLSTQSFAAWDGSAKAPERVTRNDSLFYEITSPEELVGYLENLNSSPDSAHAYLKNDIVFGTDTSSLSTVLRQSSKLASYLNSVFDGQGHSIYGYRAVGGVFETIGSEGTVKNLNIANSEIGSDTSYSIGALVNSGLGVVENVEVRNTKVFSAQHAGGIAGFVNTQDDRYPARILNSRMVGGSVTGKSSVGGIAAWVNGGLENVYNSATVSIEELNNEIGSTVFVGGIAGTAKTSGNTVLSSLTNEGDVSAYTNRNYTYAGGVIGSLESEVSGATNKGTVLAKTKGANSYTGGILGEAVLNSSEKNLNNLSNQGAVTAITWEQDTVKVNFYTGGIVGYAKHANLTNAFNSGNIDVSARGTKAFAQVGGIVGYYKTEVSGRKLSTVGNWGDITVAAGRQLEVGGIAGYLSNYTESLSSNILSLGFNHGDVTAASTLDTTRMYIFHVGGAVGYSERGIIRDIYNTGNVAAKNFETLEDTRFEGEINFVGGLVGSLYGNSGTALVNSYSAAKKIEGDKIGGIVGTLYYGVPTRKNSFDSTLVKLPAAGDTSFMYDYNPGHDLATTGKTTAYMTSDKFTSYLNTMGDSLSDRGIWNRDDERNGGYPFLDFDTTTSDTTSPAVIDKLRPDILADTVKSAIEISDTNGPADPYELKIVVIQDTLKPTRIGETRHIPRVSGNMKIRREGNLLRVYSSKYKGGEALFDLTGHRIR